KGHEARQALTLPLGHVFAVVVVKRIVALRDLVLKHLSALGEFRGKATGMGRRHVLVFVEQRHYVAVKRQVERSHHARSSRRSTSHITPLNRRAERSIMRVRGRLADGLDVESSSHGVLLIMVGPATTTIGRPPVELSNLSFSRIA